MALAKPGYNDLVFINCPFDQSYFPILRTITLLFTGVASLPSQH